MASTVHLTRLLLADMVARDAGRLLLTSSIASTMPGSYQAVYNASKSFVQSLAEALQDELKDTEVTRHVADARPDGDELLPPGRDGRHPRSARAPRTTPPTWPSRATTR